VYTFILKKRSFPFLQLEENNYSKYDLLRSAFEEDEQLFNHNNTSWVKSLFQMKNLFNLPSLDIYVQKNNLYTKGSCLMHF
jgi:hypothetical protein